MTGSAAYNEWLHAGQPDSGLALPLAQLRDVLRGAGYTVYDRPNAAHLQAVPPEDHTPFSATGYPGTSPRWWRHAIDVMPKPGATGPRDLWLLGARIAGDRNAGLITWLKYINRPPGADLSRAIQDSWQPGHAQRSSSDTGHLHLSSVTGVETLSAPYNPLTTTPEGTTMALSRDDIINTASAVVQWATEDGALPGQFRGATTNLMTLEAQLKALGAELDTVRSQASSNGGGITSIMTALSAMSSKLETLSAAVAAQHGTGDVPVTGTLHLG